MIDFSDNVGRCVSITWRHMVAYMARKMEPLQIGVGQYPFLFSLYIEDGLSQQSLSDRLLLDKAAAVRAIDKLEEAGYVKRYPDSQDKRSVRIYLTEKGKAVRPQLEAIVEEVREILLKDMSLEERDSLTRLMGQMAGNIIQALRGSN